MESQKELVTMAERRLIQKEMSVEFGTKVKHRVIDLDKVVQKIREDRARFAMSPYIEIKPISPDMHKVPSRTSTYQKDPVTGVLYGIPISQDEFGNMRWQKIQIGDNMSLNLDEQNEAKIWAVLRFCPDIKGSPFAAQNPYYEIFDPEAIAKAEMGEVAHMKKAFERIDLIENNPVDMVYFARFLGEEIRENASVDIVTNTLLRFAKNRPEEFNRRWDSKVRSFGERFATAVFLGIITQDVDKGYVYQNIPLGQSEEEALRLLSKDHNIMSSLNDKIEQEDKVIKQMKEELAFRESKKEKISEDLKTKKKEKAETVKEEF
jgi:hypothetical protein